MKIKEDLNLWLQKQRVVSQGFITYSVIYVEITFFKLTSWNYWRPVHCNLGAANGEGTWFIGTPNKIIIPTKTIWHKLNEDYSQIPSKCSKNKRPVKIWGPKSLAGGQIYFFIYPESGYRWPKYLKQGQNVRILF